jgi:hypothetical protein
LPIQDLRIIGPGEESRHERKDPVRFKGVFAADALVEPANLPLGNFLGGEIAKGREDVLPNPPFVLTPGALMGFRMTLQVELAEFGY